MPVIDDRLIAPVVRGASVDAMLIEGLVGDLVIAQERNMSLEDDVAIYREIAQASLDALAQLATRHQRLLIDYAREREQFRALRECVLIEAGADENAT